MMRPEAWGLENNSKYTIRWKIDGAILSMCYIAGCFLQSWYQACQSDPQAIGRHAIEKAPGFRYFRCGAWRCEYSKNCVEGMNKRSIILWSEAWNIGIHRQVTRPDFDVYASNSEGLCWGMKETSLLLWGVSNETYTHTHRQVTRLQIDSLVRQWVKK